MSSIILADDEHLIEAVCIKNMRSYVAIYANKRNASFIHRIFL